jgi:hypothetical protein
VGPDYDIKNELGRRIVRARMSGTFDEKGMRAWCVDYRERATKPYKGKRHMVIADMRGMKTVHPSIAALMGEEIGYARMNGVVLCAHISDDTVQRLQAARVARQNSANDDATIDVATIEEAERVVENYQRFLDDPRFAGSIRAAL